MRNRENPTLAADLISTWQSDGIQLLHGDALLLLPRLAPRSIPLVLTDPPYNTTDAVWDGDCPLMLWWPMVERAATNPVIIFSAQPFTSEVIAARRRWFRREIIWHKTRAVGHLSAKKGPLRAHENVLVLARRAPAYYPQKSAPTKPGDVRILRSGARRSTLYHSPGKTTAYVDDGSRYPTDVFLAGKDVDGSAHPCSKPVALLEWLIRSYSRPGDLVLDPFMGSGSTGVACARAGRRFLGIEQDATFFALAKRRISAAVTG